MRHLPAKLKKDSHKFLTVSAILLAAAISLPCLSSGFAASNDPLQIHLSNNLLSALIESSPLIKVLEKLQITAGLEFAVADEAARQPITVQFHSLPLETALKTILNGFNYSLVYGPNDSVQKVTVLRNMTAKAIRESQPMPLNKSVAFDSSAGEGPESRQDDSSIVQKEPSETAGISSLSDAVMVVSPPSSGGMDIKSMLETMQIGPPQADDSMKMNISSKNPE